jgi:predicted AAA+ superfamily ATPase
MKRYLTEALSRDVQQKAVLLTGPRQVGKSTLAQSLFKKNIAYYNWDIRYDQQTIRQMGWPKDASLVVLDELHKFHKWKNYLKGIIDAFHNRPPLLITGSARLDIMRKGGDALTGRTFLYRLHPIDIKEALESNAVATEEAALVRLLQAGGFPEAFLHPHNAARLLNDRLDFVVREDLRDLSRTSHLRAIALLVELLRERVGSPVSFANLAQDLSVAPATISSWVELLEKLFIVFRVSPYSTHFNRANRKEPKFYFYDCAAPYDEGGARLENLVACALKKACDYQADAFGDKYALAYFRDRDGREVDFILTQNRKMKFCMEVKTSDAALSKHLVYVAERAKPEQAFQLVRALPRTREIGPVKIVRLETWLRKIDCLFARAPKSQTF